MNDSTTNRAPASKIDQYWPITAAIWRNVTTDGKVWYSVTFERSYKKEGEEKFSSSDSFSGEDLLVLQKVAGLAHTETYRLRKADRDTVRNAARQPGEEG